MASQPLNRIKWQAPVDLAPQYSGSYLLIHYGPPLIMRQNTVLLPVKTGAADGFKVEARDGGDGSVKWSLTSDYSLPAHNWKPTFGMALTPRNRLCFPAAGGTVRYRDMPDAAAGSAAADLADFEGDGIRNLLEYALDLDPMLPDAAALPPPLIDGGYLTFSFVPSAAATDLTYSAESSLDFENWGTADVEDVTPAIPDPPGQRTFRYRHALGPSISRVFLRLKATRNY